MRLPGHTTNGKGAPGHCGHQSGDFVTGKQRFIHRGITGNIAVIAVAENGADDFF